MNRFGPYPFVRILLPFIFGIIADILFQLNDSFTVFLVVFLTILYTTDYLTVNLFGRYEFRIWNGVYLTTLLFLTGSFWVSVMDDRKSEFHYLHHPAENTFVVQLTGEPQEKENSVKAEVRVLAGLNHRNFERLHGKCILYFQKNKDSKKLKYGDEILVQTQWNEVSPPQNPGEFDYKNYLSHKRIFAQGYADSLHWRKMSEAGNFIFRASIQSRNALLQILSEAGLKDQEFAVASALILGYTGEINAETKSAYSSSGALHVLSVSGLHVAIIFAVFDKLLFFLLRMKRGKYYKAILILIFLWSYAFLTGLSPSVMRSAAMLSFVVVGKMINRNASIYNILCASAFVLLLIDPLLITDVGFQLSYLAVLGIVYLQPKIDAWFTPKSRWMDFIWSVTSVSLAAQLATFPLGMYYFHQFPNYFLISNLIVIPLGTVILYNGILALVFSFVPGLNDVLIFTLKWSVRILNESVLWIEKLPFSVAKGIYISAFECILIYLIIVSCCIYFEIKKTIFLKISMASISALFLLFSVQKWQQKNQEIFIVYKVNKHSAVDFISGRQYVFLADNELKDDLSKIQFHMENHRHIRGLNSESGANVLQYRNYFLHGNLKICMVDTSFIAFMPRKKLKVDVLLISQNPRIHLTQLDRMFEYEFLVIDSSNDFFHSRTWKKEGIGNNKLYFVNEKGAFILNG